MTQNANNHCDKKINFIQFLNQCPQHINMVA